LIILALGKLTKVKGTKFCFSLREVHPMFPFLLVVKELRYLDLMCQGKGVDVTIWNSYLYF
jgi:hypothetical protein